MKRIFHLILLGLLSTNFINADNSLPFLIAYYPFDYNANDFGGNGNNGTADKVDFRTGGTGIVGVFGKISSVRVADNITFNFSSASAVTFAVRVKQESRTNGYILVKKGTSGSADEYSLALTEDGHVTGEFVENSTVYEEVTSNTILNLDTWYDIILIWKNTGEISLYIDGDMDTLTTSSVTSIQNTNLPFIIGDPDTTSVSNSFVGSLEDIYIYDRALSKAEISEFSIYTKPTGIIQNSSEEDCILYPNPVTDEVNISTSLIFRNSRFRITGLDGKSVMSGELGTEDSKLNLSYLKPGLYNLQIENGSRMVNKKILKQ